MIEWILFDIGGVFLHASEGLLAGAARRHGVTRADIDVLLHGRLWDVYKRGGMDEGTFWTEAARLLPDAFDGRVEELRREVEASVWADESQVALTRRLSLRYRIAALSNAGAELERRLRRFDIDGLFEIVVNSHRVRMAKPDEAVYLHAAQRLGVHPRQVLFVDDKERNTQAADRLGFATHHFTGSRHLRRFLKQPS